MSNPNVSTLMLGNGELDQISNPLRGDAYYGFKDGVHTMAVTFDNFKGRMYVEASLDANPQEADWFPIWLTRTAAYKEYTETKTGTESFSFLGNLVLIRFRKERSYMSDTSNVGDIVKVMLSL